MRLARPRRSFKSHQSKLDDVENAESAQFPGASSPKLVIQPRPSFADVIPFNNQITKLLKGTFKSSKKPPRTTFQSPLMLGTFGALSVGLNGKGVKVREREADGTSKSAETDHQDISTITEASIPVLDSSPPEQACLPEEHTSSLSAQPASHRTEIRLRRGIPFIGTLNHKKAFHIDVESSTGRRGTAPVSDAHQAMKSVVDPAVDSIGSAEHNDIGVPRKLTGLESMSRELDSSQGTTVGEEKSLTTSTDKSSKGSAPWQILRREATGVTPSTTASTNGRGQQRSGSLQVGGGESGQRVSPPSSQWHLPQLPKLPGWGDNWTQFQTQLRVMLSPPGHPDKRRLMTVQEFFKYTADEGRRFFEELDRDGDERVTVEDVKLALKKRGLPDQFASKFVQSTRGNRWWSNSIGWDEFRARVDEREPRMLQAFTSMEVNPAGSLDISQIKKTLEKVGVSATDADARAMIKALGAQDDGSVSYGKFRNFLILLPDAHLVDGDPSIAWFEAATIVPFGPPTRKGGTGRMLLQAALAGGIASGGTTLALFPLDTLKTRVQSTAGATIAEVARSAPKIGFRGLYRGVVPAVSGQFVSHGLRTFAYEGTFQALSALTRGAAELQLQGLASGVGTFLGTCIRIPCEVLKQRLQVGRYNNVLEAARQATELEGVRGLFRGTTATLAREVPFYVFGMVGYEQLKKIANGSAFGRRRRELADWEMIALGGMAGALASLLTTPADVMKTRIMTAAADRAVNGGAILADIIKTEGVGALFKGALPRMVWIAPLGAMNFAGYELAKRALKGKDDPDEKEEDAQSLLDSSSS